MVCVQQRRRILGERGTASTSDGTDSQPTRPCPKSFGRCPPFHSLGRQVKALSGGRRALFGDGFPLPVLGCGFRRDSDDSDLGARHSPAPGPAQRQRFSDQLQRHVLWSALGDHIRRRGGADLRASTNRFRAIQSRQAQMPPQGIQREVVDLLSQDDQHLEVRLLNDTIGGLRRLFQSSLLENDQEVLGTLLPREGAYDPQAA